MGRRGGGHKFRPRYRVDAFFLPSVYLKPLVSHFLFCFHGWQVQEYGFDSSAVEVALLAVVRLIVLAIVLVRSKSCLVRVRGDGTILPSVEAVIAMALCALSACYCVFKVNTLTFYNIDTCRLARN